MRDFNVVKLWYQNDWGRFRRRDERLTRALLRHPAVRHVVHLEPPVVPERRDERTDPAGATARRLRGVREDRLFLYTPALAGRSPQEALLRAVRDVEGRLEAEGIFRHPVLLWLGAPSVFGDLVLRLLGARFAAILTELEDDHRHYCPPRGAGWIAMHRRYEFAVRCSDLLVSNARSLLDEFQPLQPRVLHLPNAVDPAEYRGDVAAPAWLAAVPRPRLTYVGNLRVRIREDLLHALVRALPEATLVLAGDGGPELKARLGAARIVAPGRLAPELVPGLLCASDVLLLPHVVGPYTDAMDPQKLYEYLASGRPIAATPVAGARELGRLLSLADDAQGFVEAVRRCLHEPGASNAEARRAAVQEATWERRVEDVIAALSQVPDPGHRLRRELALGYFEHDRPEVRALVPAEARRILDVGCGAGALGHGLLLEDPARQLAGIEADARAAARARERYGEVHEGDAVEELRRLEPGFDAVVLADVLEHLPRPEEALAEVRRLLSPGGRVVVSLPNVRHWSVVRELLEGEWRYQDRGILDRTHLRFFTHRSARRLLEENGFEVLAETGARWSEEPMPAPVVQALRAGGLALEGMEQESGDHQVLLVGRPVARSVEPRHVAVIVPVSNAEDYTRRCLEELARHGPPGAEIVVVDNGSTDGTAALLASVSGLRVIRNASNLGFAAAVNQGLRATGAPLVCILNNDTLLTEDWWQPLFRPLAELPDVGAVGPCTSYARGAQQIDLSPCADEQHLRARVKEWTLGHRGVLEDVEFLSGFCLAARREVLLQQDGFAEAYGRGTFEDTELSRRLRRAGLRLLIARDSYVYHFGNRTFQALGLDLMQEQRANQELFLARHRGDAVFPARAAAERGAWRDAFEAARRALHEFPGDLDALALAGIALARLGMEREAAALAQRYRRRCPFDPRFPAAAESPSGSGPGSRKGFPSPGILLDSVSTCKT